MNLETTRLCTQCGVKLPLDAPTGLCPRCLLQPGLVPTEPPALGPNIPLERTGEEEPGKNIGPYKILQRLGEGGCGVVYMAEQQQPVKRRVALKVIKLGMDTRQVVGRDVNKAVETNVESHHGTASTNLDE